MAKVLIVDDAAFMRMMIKDILEKNDFEIVGEANNGLVAVDMYKKEKPDVVHLFWGHYPSLVGFLVNKVLKNSKISNP